MRWLTDAVDICVKARYLLLSSHAHYVCVHVFLCMLQGKQFFFPSVHARSHCVTVFFVHILCLRDTIPPSISLTAGNRRHLREAHGFYINQASVWCVNVYSRHVNRMLSASQHLSVRVLTCHQCSPSSSVRTSLLWAFPFCLDNKANWQV